MNPAFQAETERLERAWARHDPGMLRDYLVAGVEDPRINVQSVWSRHFLIRQVFGERHAGLMEAEYRFVAALNQLLHLGDSLTDQEEAQAIGYALARGADQCEGRMLPRFLIRLWSELAIGKPEAVPNYLEQALTNLDFSQGRGRLSPSVLNTFQELWHTRLGESPGQVPGVERLKVFEPACGSANDYRFLQSYGIADFLDYTGVDLCAANIANACAMFPEVHFEVGNVFGVAARDHAFAATFVHDLFEHLSGAGVEQAVAELCRVTQRGILANCFNVEDIPEHQIRPYEDYHWNTLSVRRLTESFARQGFTARIIHIGRFLRETVGCDQTHNVNAITFEFQRG